MRQTSDLQIVNSLTYADVAGLQLGLARLPGEETPVYVDRLYRAAVSRRDHSYEGLLDELALELGLTQRIAGSIAGPADLTIAVVPGLVTVGTTTIPTVTLDGDTYLHWRTLGEVFADLAAVPGLAASLTVDATLPALQLARQGNIFTVVNEPVASQEHNLAHAGVIADSLRFNKTVPTWQLTGNVITFAGAPPLETAASYQYCVNPFDLVISEVGLLALTEPSLAQVAVSPDSVLAYQIREAIQAVMKTDRSYWTK